MLRNVKCIMHCTALPFFAPIFRFTLLIYLIICAHQTAIVAFGRIWSYMVFFFPKNCSFSMWNTFNQYVAYALFPIAIAQPLFFRFIITFCLVLNFLQWNTNLIDLNFQPQYIKFTRLTSDLRIFLQNIWFDFTNERNQFRMHRH